MDQRDNAINKLSQLMDIRVVTDGTNQVSVFTNSGIQLVGGSQASTDVVQFAGNAERRTRYATPIRPRPASARSRSSSRTARTIDMVATNAIQFRPDRGRPEIARQDPGAGADPGRSTGRDAGELAVGHRRPPAPAVTGPPGGLQLDLSNMLPGNTINLTYTNTATNTQQQIHDRARRHDPSALPLPNAASANPNTGDRRQFFRRHGARSSSQLNAALGGANLQFSNPSGLDIARGRSARNRRRRQRGLGDDDGLVADERQPRNCRCSPTAARSTPARSPAAARR